MIKLKDRDALENYYKLIGLRVVVIDSEEYIGNEHIRINTNTGVVVVCDTEGAELAIQLFAGGVLCLA